jgi:hypothetical protein
MQFMLLVGWFLKKSSRLQILGQMNRNLVRSTYGRFCIKFSQSRMKGERHRLSPQPLVLDGCSFSWFISGFVTRVTRRVSLVEQEVLSLSEHQSSPQVFGGIRVARFSFSVYSFLFLDRCLSFFFWSLCCLSFFDLRRDPDYLFVIFILFLQ